MLFLPLWAVFFLATPDASACSCAQPAIRVTPRPGDIAPRNTHVWVEVPPELADAPLVLRGPGAGSADLRRYGSADVKIIELTPRAPLAARARYEVLLGTEIVGEIAIGDVVDDKPPTWDGLQTGDVSPGLVTGCGAGEPFIVLGLGKRNDDATPTAALRYGIWTGETGKALDYDKPPVTVVSAWGDRLSLGHESRCSPANLELPASLAIGVRVLDLAGNPGPPSEADITVSATKTAPPRSQTPEKK